MISSGIPQTSLINYVATYCVTMWYPGATYHVIRHLEYVQIVHPYYGAKNSIYIADGIPLQMTNTGALVFHNCKNRFELNNILLVPTATKNLSFVHKLCNDNWVITEFDNERVKVRNKDSGEVILEGMEKSGLYCLPIGIKSSPQALTRKLLFVDLWHRHLGHFHVRLH